MANGSHHNGLRRENFSSHRGNRRAWDLFVVSQRGKTAGPLRALLGALSVKSKRSAAFASLLFATQTAGSRGICSPAF